jgi:hypothetical protein
MSFNLIIVPFRTRPSMSLCLFLCLCLGYEIGVASPAGQCLTDHVVIDFVALRAIWTLDFRHELFQDYCSYYFDGVYKISDLYPAAG